MKEIRIIVIYIVSFFIIFFWAAFEQAGSSLTFIADNQTDRNFFGWQMPPSMVQIFNGLFVVVFAVPFSVLWDYLRAKGKEPISPVKLAMGLVLITVSFFMIATASFIYWNFRFIIGKMAYLIVFFEHLRRVMFVSNWIVIGW